MNKLLKSLIASVAAVFGFGLLFAAAGGTAPSAADDLAKRDDETPEIVLVADDDDDDSRDRGSGVSRDATNSRFSKVSRNQDRSRGDLTRDKTRDGAGAQKRDWSDNRTNDRSRNDSRASRNTGDHTRSNYSRVSRDRDISRADLTRDKTRDGAGAQKRDFSRNLTNDRSRNDTR